MPSQSAETRKIAATVVGVFAAITAAVGFLGKSTVTPFVLDTFFGVTEHVRSQVAKHIDSGYSGVFMILPTPGDADQDQKLVFYEEPGQTVKLWVRTTARGAGTKYRLTIDGQRLTATLLDARVPLEGFLDITKRLRPPDQPPGGNLHWVGFKYYNLRSDDFLYVECTVLVSNEAPQP